MWSGTHAHTLIWIYGESEKKRHKYINIWKGNKHCHTAIFQ